MLTGINTHGKEIGVQVTPPHDEFNSHHPAAVNHPDRMACDVFKLKEGCMKSHKIRQTPGNNDVD